MSIHVPRRPTWTCYGCGDPWPCATRQRQLLAEFDRAPRTLTERMRATFAAAVADQPQRPDWERAEPGELFTRMLGWIPKTPSMRAQGEAAP